MAVGVSVSVGVAVDVSVAVDVGVSVGVWVSVAVLVGVAIVVALGEEVGVGVAVFVAVAIVLLGLAHGFNVDLFSYLFGSIGTVKQTDVAIILIQGALVIAAIILFYKELVFISFDEQAAQVSGIPTKLINTVLIILAALTVSLAIPIVGVLLISALIVIPVVAALQLRHSFKQTILYAEFFSVFSVIAGIFRPFYLDLSTGGTIVIITLAIFLVSLFLRRR